MIRRTLGLVGVVWAIAGCSGDDTAQQSEPTPEQTAEAQQAATAATTTKEMLDLANVLLGADEGNSPEGTPDDGAAAIKDNVGGGGDQGCVKVTVVEGAGMTIDFGAGCTVNNVTASGSMQVELTASGPEGDKTLTVDVGFSSLVVNGWDLDGSATFVTSGGSTFGVQLDLTHSGVTTTADLDVTAAQGVVSMAGTASVASAAGTVSLTLSDVTFTPGGCWPSGGSISTGISSLVFDATTPETGLAKLEVGQLSTCMVLPNHGSCVAQACPAGGE